MIAWFPARTQDGTATFAYDKAGNMTSANGWKRHGSICVRQRFPAPPLSQMRTARHGVHLRRGKQPSVHQPYPDGKAVTTAYDSLGNVKSQTDHDGTGITYTRDAEGRTIKEGHSDGSTTEYDYNAAVC